ncbi:MAG: precorrin-3B C(17)-methyltransferase [Eubacteriales bacterium]|nr:precorrin-3B C(17)-methyltransferase [Eubacteriales bacterium]
MREQETYLIYVVGMGPGDVRQMTGEARAALEQSDVIVGYTVYAELLKAEFPEKEYVTTPMRQEERRCRLAFDTAMTGKRTAMVCSGDAGVYGMSGLMLEIGQEYPQCRVKVIGGVTAALSGAAVLGAPLIHDFAVISLSDLLTPWEKIEKRLRCAAAADFVICIYNPASRKRADYLRRACEAVMEETGGDRVCGVVRQIGREGEEMELMPLSGLRDYKADMFTTVFIGNSETQVIGGRMVTPRGYRLEETAGREISVREGSEDSAKDGNGTVL